MRVNAAALGGFLLVACAPPDADSGGRGVQQLRVGPEHLVAFPPLLSAARFDVDPGADTAVAWCAVTTGMGGEALDPLSLAYAGVIRSALAAEDLLWRFGAGTVLQSDMSGYVALAWSNDPASCAGVYDGWGGMPPDCDGEAPTFLLLLSDEDGGLALAELDACAGAEATEVVLPAVPNTKDGEWCDLGATAGVAARAGVGVLDWSTLSMTAAGAPFDPLAVEGVRLVRHDGALEETCTALAAGEGAEVYDAAVSMTDQLPLDAARSAAGEPFDGFGEGERWLVALLGEDRQGPPLALFEVGTE